MPPHCPGCTLTAENTLRALSRQLNRASERESATDTKEPLPGDRKGALTCGGAKGTRTPNPLLAKQVRYQLRHGPEWGSGLRTRKSPRRSPQEPESEPTAPVRARRPWPGSTGPARPAAASPSCAEHDACDGATDEGETLQHARDPLRGGGDGGLGGLEPPTSSLSGKRSNRLSYRPIVTFARPSHPVRDVDGREGKRYPMHLTSYKTAPTREGGGRLRMPLAG